MVAGLVVLAPACSSSDDAGTDTLSAPTTSTDATSTDATSTTGTDTSAPATAPVDDATEPAFGSLLGFLSAYTAVGPAVTPGSEPFALSPDTVTRGTITTGEAAFVSTTGIPGGIIGGTLGDDDAVTAAFVFVDPSSPTAGTAVLSLVAATIASRTEFDQPAFIQSYGDVTADLANRAGEQRWQPSTNGSGHSLVTTVVEGAEGGSNLIEVAIVPFAGEADALAAVKPLRNEVIGLVAAD